LLGHHLPLVLINGTRELLDVHLDGDAVRLDLLLCLLVLAVLDAPNVARRKPEISTSLGLRHLAHASVHRRHIWRGLRLLRRLLFGCGLLLHGSGLLLRLKDVSSNFNLRTVVRLKPDENKELSGLYRSNGIYCTQCEAEGFRRITPTLDRPDVLATYRVRIEADQKNYPVLLSNGNREAQGELPDENLLGADVLEMLLNYENTPVSDLRISQVINDITQIMRGHGLTLPADLVMLFKTLITLEGVVKRLDGSTELLEQAKPIVLAELKRLASPDYIVRKSRRQLNTLLQTADELPQTLIRLSRRLQKGQFSLDLDLKRLDDLSHQLDRATNRLTMGIVTAALIIGSSIVMSVDKAPGFLGLTGYLLAFANSLWIIWSIWRSGRH